MGRHIGRWEGWSRRTFCLSVLFASPSFILAVGEWRWVEPHLASAASTADTVFCDGFSCTLNKCPVWIDGNVSASVPACFPRHAKQSKASLGFWFQRSLTGSRSGLTQSYKADGKKKKISSTDDRIDIYFLDGSRHFLLQCVVGFWLQPADNCDVSLPKEYTSSSAHTYTQTHTRTDTHTDQYCGYGRISAVSPHTDSVGFTHVPDPAQHFDSRKRFLLLIFCNLI